MSIATDLTAIRADTAKLRTLMESQQIVQAAILTELKAIHAALAPEEVAGIEVVHKPDSPQP